MLPKETVSNFVSALKQFNNTRMGYIEQCKVMAVNRVTNTCSVEVVSEGIVKHSIMLGATATSEDDKAMVVYPEVGSFVAVSFLDKEFNGVVVNITKLEQLLLRKGDNNISNAIENIINILRSHTIEIDKLNQRVATNTADLNKTFTFETGVATTAPNTPLSLIHI